MLGLLKSLATRRARQDQDAQHTANKTVEGVPPEFRVAFLHAGATDWTYKSNRVTKPKYYSTQRLVRATRCAKSNH